MTRGKAPAKANSDWASAWSSACSRCASDGGQPTGGAGAGNVEPGLLCSKPAVAVNYMHAPKWSDQAATLERYWPSASTDGRLPVVVLSVGFWEKSAEVPEVRDSLHASIHVRNMSAMKVTLFEVACGSYRA